MLIQTEVCLKPSELILRSYLSFPEELSFVSYIAFLVLYLQNNIYCFFNIIMIVIHISFTLDSIHKDIPIQYFLHLISHSLEKYLLNLSLTSHASVSICFIFNIYLQNIATFPPLHHLQKFDKTIVVILSSDLPMELEAGLGTYLKFLQPQLK